MTEYAMTQTAPRAKLEQSVNMSPLQPAWLRPAAITLIVIAHIAFFAAFMAWEKPSIVALESMTMDLVQEGDFFEAEEVAEAEDRPPPVVVEDPELALPPPEVMAPDAIPLPAKRDNLEKVEKQREEQQTEQATQAREAQARRHAGAPDGRSGSGASQSVCLAHVASDLRRHTPGSTSLGTGHAHVTFRINMGGGISDISVSASTPAHAALARRIVASSRGPGSCSSAYVSQSFAFH
jgi:protein TonB